VRDSSWPQCLVPSSPAGRRLAEQIDAGMIYINQPAWIDEDVSFGEIKKAGHGRQTAPLGIHEFANKQLVGILN
jgi:succinate-semialdehyde dehydrogenase / glutarate-semialdehyde dehydrogenase